MNVASLLTGLLSAILSGGLLLAIVAWRKDRRQEPVERQQAVQAETMSHVQSANILMTQALAIAEAANKRSEQNEGDNLQLKREVVQMRNRLNLLEKGFTAAVRYIHVLIEWIRVETERSDYPAPPVELEDHVDQSR